MKIKQTASKLVDGFYTEERISITSMPKDLFLQILEAAKNGADKDLCTDYMGLIYDVTEELSVGDNVEIPS